MFGVGFHADDAIIRPLESQGIRRLYPMAHDPKREMKKINHSILVNFLDLLDSLITLSLEEKVLVCWDLVLVMLEQVMESSWNWPGAGTTGDSAPGTPT